jgi:superfamily II DNA or RNA helicase
MLQLLMDSYKKHSKGSKTLIFNNGIDTSLKVIELFNSEGYPIRHLDNKTSASERGEILKWFRKTQDAILTSVSILTTGFDEPTVQTVILNRATTSLTLYHQMVGRGSRRLPSKRSFTIIDLGNNTERFGEWSEPVDWKYVFEHPKEFAEQLQFNGGGNSAVQAHTVSAEVRSQFPNSLELTFDIEAAYYEAILNKQKPKKILQQSIRQQAQLCLENSETLSHALQLAQVLKPEIEWRVKQYVKCLENASKNYKDWLIEDYQKRLSVFIEKVFHRFV